MCPESYQHDELKRLMESKLSEWFGVSIREYYMDGHRLDIYAITSTKISIYVEIIWSKGQYESDMIMLQRSDADIKAIIAGPKILEDESKVRDYTKFAIIQTRGGRTVPNEMLSGERILNEPSYVDSELKGIFIELLSQAERRISISKILSYITIELQANKEKLMSLYSSGQTTYIAYLLQTDMWDVYKDRIGEVSFTNIEALSKIYHSIRTLNQSIISLITVVDYSRPPFPQLKKIRNETSKAIDKWIEEIKPYYQS